MINGSNIKVLPPEIKLTPYEEKPKTVEIHVQPAIIEMQIRKQESKTPSIRKEK